MPNNVTNRLEINADNEKLQEIMNFLKGEPDELAHLATLILIK